MHCPGCLLGLDITGAGTLSCCHDSMPVGCGATCAWCSLWHLDLPVLPTLHVAFSCILAACEVQWHSALREVKGQLLQSLPAPRFMSCTAVPTRLSLLPLPPLPACLQTLFSSAKALRELPGLAPFIPLEKTLEDTGRALSRLGLLPKIPHTSGAGAAARKED